MNKYKAFLLILVCIMFTSPVLSEEKKAERSDSYKWYISLSGGGGSLKTPVETGTSTTGRFGFEYRPNPYIGFGLGLSGSRYKLTEKTDPIDLYFALTFLSFASRGNSGMNIFPFLLLSDVLQPTTISFGSNTLDLAFNFHPNQDRMFDPYIGIGIIGGNCTGGASCTVTGGVGRLGLQLNFSSFFLYLQGEGRSLNLASQGISVTMQENQGTLGLGFRF